MWLSYPILFRYWNNGITSVGLPHSAIQGSQDMCSFPWLFAAYHGLLRLVAPRHPPYTYCSLDHIIVSSSIVSFPFRGVVQACRAGLRNFRHALSPFKAVLLPDLSTRLPYGQSKILLHIPAFPPVCSLPLFCQISRVRVAAFGSNRQTLTKRACLVSQSSSSHGPD